MFSFLKNQDRVEIASSEFCAPLESAPDLQLLKRSMYYVEYDPDGRLEFVNGIASALIGSSIEEMQKRGYFDISGAITRQVKNVISTLKEWRSINEILKKSRSDGEVLWLNSTFLPIYCSGKLNKIVEIATDITEQVSLMEESKALQKALCRSLAVI